MTKELIIEDGPITRLTINRPERHNAINTEVGDEMIDVVTRVGRDPTVQVLILGGTGKSFCSGDDTTEGGRIPDVPWENPYHAAHIAPFNLGRHPYFQLQPLLRRIPQPVIAEVHGYCMGSGFDLVLASDFAIAAHAPEIQAPVPVPLAANHLPARPPGAPQVVLTGIRDVENINALAPGQRIPFNPTGVSVIFGDNGTGKSGYARIAAVVSRSRGATREILPNVFADDGGGPQKATAEYVVGDQTRDFDWLGEGDTPPELSQISVFDADSASVYVTREQTIAYFPFGLDLLERLSEATDSVDRALDSAQNADRSNLGMPPEVGNSEVGRAISSLPIAAAETEIQRAADFSDEQRDRLRTLERVFVAEDPARRSAELQAKAERYRGFHSSLEGLGRLLGEDSISALQAAHREAEEARAAHAVAQAQIVDALPVSGVGTETWRRLWETALEFASEQRGSVGEGQPTDWNRCPLCQEPLGADGRDRLAHLAEYVLDRSRAAVAAAEEALSTTRQEVLRGAATSVSTYEDVLRELRIDVPEFENAARQWLEEAHDVRSRCGAISPNEVWPAIRPCSSLSLEPLVGAATDFESQAAVLAAAADPVQIEVLHREAHELQARGWANEHLDAIRDEVARKRRSRRRSAARGDCATNAITQEATRLATGYVTDELARRFEAEVLALRGAPLHVQLRTAVGRRGVSRFEVTLVEPQLQATLTDVVSEGESKVVALAAFLAELSFEDSGSGALLDDPVSSLDIENRDRIAVRITTLARERQMIVLTHDVFFAVNLLELAAEAGIRTRMGMVIKTPQGTGVYLPDLPREAKRASQLIASLRERIVIARRAAGEPAQYVREVESLCAEVRRTVERCIEEVLLRRIVTRYQRPIRSNNVRELRVITEQDVGFVDQLMTKYSAFEHDQAGASRVPPPEIDDIDADVQALAAWHEEVEARVRSDRSVR